MRLRKLTSWSGSRGSKEKRQVAKDKNAKVLNSESGPINLNLHSPIRSLKLSPRIKNPPIEEEGTKPVKEDVLISKTTATSATTNPGIVSKQEDERLCLLFEDTEDDDEEVGHIGNGNKMRKKQVNDPAAKDPKLTTPEKLPPVTQPRSNKNNPRSLSVRTPKNLSLPPQEIRIDPLAVPLSPMREPPTNIMANPSMNNRLLDDYHQGIYLNYNEPSPGDAYFGDPVGDFAMQRQLLDAQRLVRILLGRPSKGDQSLLEPSTILQAIRSYALMKAELVGLRKRQETLDGDPPAILQALGSPAATTPSKTISSAYSPRRTGQDSLEISNDGNVHGFTKHVHKSPVVDGSGSAAANNDDPITCCSDLELKQAKDMIERLQKELKHANDTVLKLKKKIKTNEEKEENHCTRISSSKNSIGIQNENEDKEDLIQSHQHNDELLLEVSKLNANEGIISNSGIHSPQRVLGKDVVPEILNSYCHSPTRKSQTLVRDEEIRQPHGESDHRVPETDDGVNFHDEDKKNQAIMMLMDDVNIIDKTTVKVEEEVPQFQEESNQQIQEREDGLKNQDTNQNRQNQATIKVDKEHILDATTAKGEEEIRQSQEESEQQVQEIENGVKLRDNNQKKQNQAIANTEKEGILDATNTKGEEEIRLSQEASDQQVQEIENRVKLRDDNQKNQNQAIINTEKEGILDATNTEGDQEILLSQEEPNQQVQETENGVKLRNDNHKEHNQTIINMEKQGILDTTAVKGVEEIRQLQKKSDQEVQEAENGVKLYYENQKNQVVVMDKEHILDATTATNKNNPTILMEVSHNTANSNNSANPNSN